MINTADILKEYQMRLLKYVEEDYPEIYNIETIRVNLSAVHTCEYKNKKYLLKYLLVRIPPEYENIEVWNEYTILHTQKMIELARADAFPEIYSTNYYELDDYIFLVIIEEFLPFRFSEGILQKHKNNNYNAIDTASNFLLELLYLYKKAYEEVDFISHRDLSFDNLMFDDNYNLKMIDLGSAKSRTTETTVFALPAPTKYFYAAPEYSYIHNFDRTNDDLIKAEIYTIGLLTLSLLNALDKNLLTNRNTSDCGIIHWINSQRKDQPYGENLKEALKNEYINYILIEMFSGDRKNKLFRLLRAMTESSVSARIKDYNLIIKHLERMVR